MPSITYAERVKIKTLCSLELANVEMVDRLKRSPATISYKLSRYQPYRTNLTQSDAKHKSSHCGHKSILPGNLKLVIQNHLHLFWSPEASAHCLGLATKSIYNWPNQLSIK